MNPLTKIRDWWLRPVTDRLDHLASGGAPLTDRSPLPLPSGPLHPSTVALADRWADAIAAWPNRDRP